MENDLNFCFKINCPSFCCYYLLSLEKKNSEENSNSFLEMKKNKKNFVFKKLESYFFLIILIFDLIIFVVVAFCLNDPNNINSNFFVLYHNLYIFYTIFFILKLENENINIFLNIIFCY